MARTIVAGNWKMNTSLLEAVDLASNLRDSIGEIDHIDRVLIPPFPWIVPVRETVQGSEIRIGAQNCYTEPKGAFTGEVSPEMLSGICDFVIAGHSERRHVLGESDAVVRAKTNAILRAGLSAIVCVGETLEEREAGTATDVVGLQLSEALRDVHANQMSDIVIAYEPVWAIGTGKAASSDDAQEMAAFVRKQLAEQFDSTVAEKVSILYGGSVKSDNAADFMSCPDINGALVGGASLDPKEFTAITAAALEHSD